MAEDNGSNDDSGANDGDPSGGTDGGAGDVSALPQWARDQIAKANREAASYRTKVRELEPAARKAKELEDAGKSDAERLTGEVKTHQTRAEAAEARAMRLEVALSKGLTATQAKRLVGATVEELEADADELLASFGGGKNDKDDERKAPAGRPVERLRSGGGSDGGDITETDPRKLAAMVPRR
jgi:hypothetical protein